MLTKMLKKLQNLPIEKMLAITSIVILLGVIGLATYDRVSREEIAIKIQLDQNEDPFSKLKEVIPQDSSLSNVKEINRNDNEYIVVVNTKKNGKDLVDWIQKRKGVRSASIHK